MLCYMLSKYATNDVTENIQYLQNSKTAYIILIVSRDLEQENHDCCKLTKTGTD